jgi:ABC-2 type transport system ATP-binding protein
MIKTENLTKRFGSTLAVDNLSLEIPPGEIFAFIGPNGAGKTTTIKMLAGLIAPTSGRAIIGGQDIQKNPVEAKRLIGYIPDIPFLYEKLTGSEFLSFVAGMYGLSAKETPDLIRQELARLNLSDLAGTLIESYSHGYRQRLVFAAAFLHRPRVLIIDEPMVGLDPRSARLIKDLLRERAREGETVFMSTHTLSVAEELAHRVGIIHNGKLIACGNLEELRRQSGVRGQLEEIFLKITEEEKTVPAKDLTDD